MAGRYDPFTDKFIDDGKKEPITATISIDAFPKNIIQRNVVEVSEDSINKIADAVVRKLADRKTEPSSSEKPNNCEHITEDGVTCAKYPACDDCLDNPLNKVKGSERLVKGSEQTEPTISKMEQVEITADDFNEDDESCENCRWFNPMKSLGCNLDDDECYYSPKDEPQTDDIGVPWTEVGNGEQADNGIGCSRCESRYDCYDRDMPHAVRCNNYGKITDGKE